MRGSIWLSLVVAFLLLLLFPLLFANLMAASLVKLHLDPDSAVMLVVAIVIGSFINIPVRRIRHDHDVTTHPLAAFGMVEFWPRLRRARQATIIAVNVGGCVIPTGLALYEFIALHAVDSSLWWAVITAAGVNIAVCYVLARPVAGLGIALPGLVPGLVAALLALVLAPDQASPVAFIAGVAGPLIGADLLHLRDIEAVASGVLSIGGAGTFDGIVLSGIIAAYLT